MIKAHRLKLYNSISGEKELFKSIHPDRVGMYVCGPTVYSNVHLGNLRTFLSFDIMFRYLLHLGYKVRYVRNLTDAGHLTDDSQEDKISTRAKLEQIEPMEVVQKYTVDFHQILQTYNVLPPSIEPTATGHILEQIQATQKLMQKGLAYEINGSVYFDVQAYNDQYSNSYGELSRRKIDELLINTRALDGQDEKRSPQDFALWKKASPEHIMRWSSPWGEGFPGWHLECTVMSTKYLGDTFDIHGGGLDLKFPHHECEIAQAKGLHSHSPANYWLHANMLTLNGQKMSKSTGNTVLPMELINGKSALFTKPFQSSVVRFAMLQAHYRSVMDLSDEALKASEKGLEKLQAVSSQIQQIKPSEVSSWSVQASIDKVYESMDDDFNTPTSIAQLFGLAKDVQKTVDGVATLSQEDLQTLQHWWPVFMNDVLGLSSEHLDNGVEGDAQKLLDLIITLRSEARQRKDFATSDVIRDHLANMGLIIKDALGKTIVES